MTTQYEVDTGIEPGLRYTEEVGNIVRSFPVRYCCLWQTDEASPISELEAIPIRQRFGAVSIPAEGIGGVETKPKFRRQGHLGKLMTLTLACIARRVDVAFVSEGIEGVYEKFGFVPCMADTHLTLSVRNVERVTDQFIQSSATRSVRSFSPADLPAMASLYNAAHANRPWTLERQAGWNRLVAQETWRPGSEVIVLAEDNGVIGYAILQGRAFGHEEAPFIVDELSAVDAAAAYSLLAEIAARCWQVRHSRFRVHEPLDSLVGQVARLLGCEVRQEFPWSGGMMGTILNRSRLVAALEPELRRRLNGSELVAEHAAAYSALCSSELIPDNRILLRLLLGYWSLLDALTYGTCIPEPYQQVCAGWFPGGGSPGLLLPYAHRLDRY